MPTNRRLDRHTQREALTSSDQSVDYQPNTRYEIAGGYLNLPGIAGHDPAPPPGTPEDVGHDHTPR